MKQIRKEALLHSFPILPHRIANKMKGKGAENYCVFLTNGKELFIRCYHRYSNGSVFERQRYVFAKDGAVRYVCNIDEEKNPINWRPSKMREPSFYCAGYYGRYSDNSYIILNDEAIKDSDMKYCPIDEARGLPIELLNLYVKHPNIEYLFKANYGCLISKEYTYSYYANSGGHLTVPEGIDWKSNNLLKMLRLSRYEFKLLQGKEKQYQHYIWWRNEFPKEKPEYLLQIAEYFGAQRGTADKVMNMTGYSLKRIVRYLKDQNLQLYMYTDYLEQCNELKYNLHDTAICFPHDFTKMHNRLTEIISVLYEMKRRKKDKEKGREIARQIRQAKKNRQKMEFSFEDLILRQPVSADEIIEEGRKLHHCVGGYVDRHLKAQTNIFFIRKKSAPDKPYFTIEVNNRFNVVQCHGYKNDPHGRPPEIDQFVEQYKNHLEELKNERDHNKRAV